jgi:hypothetical protein
LFAAVLVSPIDKATIEKAQRAKTAFIKAAPSLATIAGT